MQISIYKIFDKTKMLFALMLLLTILLAATISSEYSSFYKLENLQKEKELATAIYTHGRDKIELANIQFHGNSTILRHEVEALSALYAYDYISQFMQTGNYQEEIDKLKEAVSSFNKAAGEWYTQEQLPEEELQARKEDLMQKYSLLMERINTITSENLAFEQKRFYLQESLASALLVLTLFGFFWIFRRLSQIQKDIRALYALENEETAEYLTIEGDTISKRFIRTGRTPTTTNPAYLDPLTGINNQKGFVREFGDKKSHKVGNYTAICIFSIDKLKEMELQYSQDFIDGILKKVGFMLTLYRQHNDVIGRLNHNQFAILLSRQDKASTVNDCELIRKSVQETPFKTSDGQNLTITLSGGFVQKFSAQTVDEVVTKAAKVLSMSIQHGGNRIAQLRDKDVSIK